MTDSAGIGHDRQSLWGLLYLVGTSDMRLLVRCHLGGLMVASKGFFFFALSLLKVSSERCSFWDILAHFYDVGDI